MCWHTTPAQITTQYPSLARPIDLDAIAGYLASDRTDIEYISPFFPRQRAEDFCRYKMAHSWDNHRIASAFPQTAALTDLPALREKTLDLHRSHVRYLKALKSRLNDHAFLDRQIAAVSETGRTIAANA